MSAVIIPFKVVEKKPVKCSFCGTPKNEDTKMIESSTGAVICSACLRVAKQRAASVNIPDAEVKE